MTLRLPNDLKAKLETAAKASRRSLHAEILHTLDQRFATTHTQEPQP